MHKQIAFFDIAPPTFIVGRDSLYRWAWNLSQIQKKRQQHSGSARGAIRETEIVDDFTCRKTGESFNLS